jgi:hypothetical protein
MNSNRCCAIGIVLGIIGLGLSPVAMADSFGSGANQFEVNFVTITGDSGNWATDPCSPWDVGSVSEELSGLFDMMANVCKWNEAILFGSGRGLRRGSRSIGGHYLVSSTQLASGCPYIASRYCPRGSHRTDDD